jgi:type IV fimbrial biogenesis protein FimT
MDTRRSRGFTLLELLTAITTLSVLLSIGVPSFTAMIRRNRVATHTNELVMALAAARSEAMKRGESIAICSADATQSSCAGNWSGGWIMVSDGSVPGVLDGADVILQHWAAPSEDHVDVSGSAGYVRFRPDGSGDYAKFDVAPPNCQDGDARVIVVSLSGALTTQAGVCP